MLPILGSGSFSNTQAIDWSIQWFDSSMTVPERGIGFRLFNPTSTFNTAAMNAAADPTTYIATNGIPVLTNSGTWGLTPLVLDYWGGGAPAGIASAGFAVLHYKGFFSSNRTWAHTPVSNILLQSETLDSGVWNKFHSTITVNNTTAPNGTLTGDKVVEDSTTNAHALFQSPTFTLLSGQCLIGSAFFKPAERTKVTVYVADTLTIHGGFARFNLANGTVEATGILGSGTFNGAQITAASNGWYWAWVSVSADGTNTGILNVHVNDASGTDSYLGDGTSGLYMWGAQLEVARPENKLTPSPYSATGSILTPGVGTASAWLAFSGRGFIRVQLNGSDILKTRLNQLLYVDSTLLTPNPGDRLDIFYWQLGEDWGGLVGKYVVQQVGQGSAISNITDLQHREAPVLAASLIPYSVATAFTLPQVVDVRLDNTGPLSATTLTFKLLLTNAADLSGGWQIINHPRRARFVDPITKVVTTLKRGQLIKFFGGFQSEQYPRFTGRIVNIDEQSGSISIECQDFSERLQRLNVNNYPDLVSYETFNYFNFSDLSFGQPVFGIFAYDSWPLEHTIKDLAYRAGIDPKLFYGLQQVNSINSQVLNVTDTAGSYQYLTKARSVSNALLLLQRNSRYGNVGGAFQTTKNADDTYLYRGTVTQSIADWSRELTDTLGYDWRFDANGNLVLLPRNNPTRFTKFNTGTPSYSPAAITGVYQLQNSGWVESAAINGERIDLAVGRSPNTGIINYTIQAINGITLSSGQLNTGLIAAPTAGVFIYDNQFDISGNNLCVFTLYQGQWGQFRVTVSGVGGGVWWLDSLLSWDRNSQATRLPVPLQTDIMIEQLTTQSLAQSALNDVIAIGAIKSTITDTQKAQKINNPDYEFYVSRAVDPSSIWDPSSTNYMGGRIASLIVDKKISNQNYANWVAQTLLFRQRDPGPSLRVTHPIIPFIEPRDKLALIDTAFNTVTNTDPAWVQSYVETYEAASAISEMTLTSYQQIPSYDPNQSLTADQIDNVFFGQPIINFNITYPSLDAGTVTNPGPNLTDARLWGNSKRSYLQRYSNDFTTYGSDGFGSFIDLSGTNLWPPVPDSITLGLSSGTAAVSANTIAIYKNNPYMKFTHIFDYTQQKIHVPCLAGDSTAAYSVAGFNLSQGHVTYQAIDKTILANVYSGVSPFYDPYQSELPDGQLIAITFDTLTTGYYRVSVWNARNLSAPVLVAWLTEPTASDPDPESHWTYMTAGRNNIFQWDGVDNIGEWNSEQSDNYAWAARGWFEKDQKPAIGAGFYVWNDQTSDVVAISNQTSAGKLVFNPDHFSQFFVKIECKNEAFSTKAATIGDSSDIRVAYSYDLKGVALGQNPKSQIYIYTHLPPPTTIQMAAIEDWDFTRYGSYDPLVNPLGATGWVSKADYGASIRNDKPVRITLQANPRPGSRFQNNRAYTSFKLHNVIHLNLAVLDSFMMFMGQTWAVQTGIEMKRLVNRRLLDDKNTLELVDADWRTGDTLDLPNQRWIFRPQDLTVVHDGITEAIRYCDYLQVTDVPGFSQDRTMGQPWSRLIIAYLAYIFYLSSYIQDRSGRMTWAIDPNFIDKSKIVFNTFATTHPEELDEYSVRTIVGRQWVDPNYVTSLANTWQIPNLVSGQSPANFIQFFHQRLDIGDDKPRDPLTIDLLGNPVPGFLYSGFTDIYSDYIRKKETINRLQPKGANNQPSDVFYRTDRQLGGWNDSTNQLTSYLGLWSWEGDYNAGTAQQYDTHNDPLWIPDLTRDFHPFFLSPPTVFELSRIPFWTAKTLPLYGPSNIYDTYARYAYGQGTCDPNLADRRFETWMAVTFPANDTRVYNDTGFNGGPGFGPHRTFLNIGVDVAHFVDFTLPDNSNFQNRHAIFNTEFDYTRQQEWRFWENYRGIVTIGSVYVAPGSAYLMNSWRYDLIVRSARGPYQNVFSASISSNGTGIDSTLSNSVDYLYVTQIRPYIKITSIFGIQLPGGTFDRSWFTWTFRNKYNWYSPSFFPCSSELKIHPRFLYPKYTMTNIGQPPIFDAGAWVGWKDDLDASVQQITWRDSILESAGDFARSLAKLPRVSSSPDDNIFITGTPRAPIALGPRLAESTDVIITLSLVNSRRRQPVTGIGP